MLKGSSRGKSAIAIVVMVLGMIMSSVGFTTISSAATIKTGVICKKNNQKAKSAGKNYVCLKNPYVTPTKLTWMLRECPQTHELYTDSKEQYGIFKDILSSAGAEGKIEADKLLKGISDLKYL